MPSKHTGIKNTGATTGGPPGVVTIPCRSCDGEGERPLLSCGTCAALAALTFAPPPPARHFTRRYVEAHEAFPCGHEIEALPPVISWVSCDSCAGTGGIQREMSPDRARRHRAREEERQRRLASHTALRLYEYGYRAEARRLAPTCGARCRDGHPCRARVVLGRLRCRRHGGLSTGPRTSEGRERIAESNRRRASYD